MGRPVRSSKERAAAVALLAAAVATAPSRGQSLPADTQFVVDRFQPGAGSTDVLSIGGVETLDHLDLHLSAYFAYARDPLRLIAVGIPQGGAVPLLRYQSILHLGVSIGLFDRFELGLVAPLAASQGSSGAAALGTNLSAGGGVGDLRLVPKVRLFQNRYGSLGFALPLSLPTGGGRAFLSQDGLTASPELRAETTGSRLRLVANAGVALRAGRSLVNLQLHNALSWGLAAELPFQLSGQTLAALATIGGEVGFSEATSLERPTELMLALRWFLPAYVSVTAGGGPGLTSGYGTPRYRLFVGVGLDPRKLYRQRTSVVAPAPAPLAPLAAEDLALRTAAETPVEVPVRVVGRPAASVVVTSVEGPSHGQISRDATGQLRYTPAPGYAGSDELTLVLSDGTGPEARSRVRVEVAPAPPLPPPPPPAPAPAPAPAPPPVAPVEKPSNEPQQIIRDGRIALLAQVQFAHDKAVILPQSMIVLDKVAQVLRAHPEYKKVRVDGHTDSHGRAAYNRKLSQRRAEAVLGYLVRDGIERERLDARGFGPDQPLGTNDTEEGRARNRRVEFVVTDGPRPAP